MTNKEAKEIIESECYVFNPLNFDRTTRINTALDMAIKALEKEPCEDYISKEALYNELYDHFHDEDAPNDITYVRLGTVRNFVKSFPSATQTRPKGHWIDNNNGTISCSYCYTWFYKDDRYSYMRYCPYCGSRMDENKQHKRDGEAE